MLFPNLFILILDRPTFFQVYKKKSTEGFQSIPYVVGLFSAMLWIYYALLKTDAMLLITINSVGCFIEAFYIGFFLFYAPKKIKVLNSLIVHNYLKNLQINIVYVWQINNWSSRSVLIIIYSYGCAKLNLMQIQTVKVVVLLNVVGLGLIVVLSQFLAKGPTRIHIVGWICLIFSLSVFVAPLGVVVCTLQWSQYFCQFNLNF